MFMNRPEATKKLAESFGVTTEHIEYLSAAAAAAVRGLESQYGIPLPAAINLLFPPDQEFKLPEIADDGAVILTAHLDGEMFELRVYPADKMPEDLDTENYVQIAVPGTTPAPKPGKFGWGGYL